MYSRLTLRGVVLTCALILLTLPAHAAREFSWSGGTCAPASTGGEAELDNWETDADMPFNFFGAARPDKSTDTFGDAQNKCSHRFNPTSAQTMYLGSAVSVSSTPVMSAYLKVTTAPTTRRTIMALGPNGCQATIEVALGNQVTLKVFFDEFDLPITFNGGLCQGSLNDDTKCDIGCTSDTQCQDRGFDATCTAGQCNFDEECPNTEPGESQCSEGAFANYTFDIGEWQIVTLKQTNGTGTVKCQLWAGAPGFSRSRGAGTHTVTACVGDDNEACITNADCATSNCGTKNTTVDRVYWGTSDTNATAADYLLDSFLYDSSSTAGMINYRMPELVPNDNTGTQDATQQGCSGNHAACLDETDDNTSPDEGTTRLNLTSTGTKEDFGFEDITLGGTCAGTPLVCSQSNITCTANADCAETTIPSVSFVTIVKDRGNPSTGTKTFQPCALDNTADTESCGNAADLLTHNSGEYIPDAYVNFTLTPDGVAWTEADVDAIRLRLKYVEVGSVDAALFTTSHMMPEISLPDPPVPTNITDNNGDGDDTVTFLGDSRWNLTGFWNALVGGLIEPVNILDCAHGGATPGDGDRDMADILQGKTTQQMPCLARSGSANKLADVILTMIDVNGLHRSRGASPDILFDCTTNADCPSGATCDRVSSRDNDVNRCSFGRSGYCLSYCSTNSDCTVGNCTGNADCNQSGAVCTCDEHGSACNCPRNSFWESDTGSAKCGTDGTGEGVNCNSGFSGSSDCTCSTNSDCGPFNCAAGICSAGTCTSATAREGASCVIDADCDACSDFLASNASRNAINGPGNPSSICLPGCTSVTGCTDGLCYAENEPGEIYSSFLDMATIIDNSSSNADAVWVLSPYADKLNPLSGWRWINESLSATNSWLRNFAISRGDSFIDMAACMKAKVGGDIDSTCYDGVDGIHFTSDCLQFMGDCVVDFFANDAANDGVCTASKCSAGRLLDTCTTNTDCHTYMRTF